ncbi:hypothetical protein ACP4OV_016396 [Aristida adscensionis]
MSILDMRAFAPLLLSQTGATMATRQPTSDLFPPHLAAGLAAFTFLLAAAVYAPLTARSQEHPPPWPLCDPSDSGTYTQNSTYQANIRRLAATLPKNASSSSALYAKDSVGAVPDAVYAHALCRGDAGDASACASCVAAAFRGAQRRCPLAKDVMIFYDLCYLRFSNRDFFTDDDYIVDAYLLQGARLSGAPPPATVAAFDAAVRRVVNATADYAAASPRRFGTGVEAAVGVVGGKAASHEIYALSQCTPDKTPDICRSCLGVVTRQLQTEFSGLNGGGILGVWCSFRYETHPFFSGRPLLQLPAFVAAPPPTASTGQGRKLRNKAAGRVLAIVMPIIAALLAITVISFWAKKRRSAAQSVPPSASNSSDDIENADMLIFDLSTIRAATEDFAESRMLGKGGFGMVYKGVLPDGQEIAVKRLCQSSRQGMGELKSELVVVSKLHHKNLVRLIGVCLQDNEKILVYEYMPNRSLDTILFDSEKNEVLDWGKRFQIINGIARGLQYLHEDSQLKIVHRDLKASNVLLDLDYVPKISDFGLAKIFGGDQSKYVTHRIAGTYGYMAPEYAMRGQYSIKSDVFSFGVLVLEIVMGRRNSGLYNSEQADDLLNLVWERWTRGNVMELVDQSLSDHPPIDQILKCIHIGLLCVQRKPAARPIMSWVNIMLCSSTVRLPSLSRPTFFIHDQEASVSESSDVHSATQTRASVCTDSSVEMSYNEASISELLPR